MLIWFQYIFQWYVKVYMPIRYGMEIDSRIHEYQGHCIKQKRQLSSMVTIIQTCLWILKCMPLSAMTTEYNEILSGLSSSQFVCTETSDQGGVMFGTFYWW